jgi:hypothetical protein
MNSYQHSYQLSIAISVTTGDYEFYHDYIAILSMLQEKNEKLMKAVQAFHNEFSKRLEYHIAGYIAIWNGNDVVDVVAVVFRFDGNKIFVDFIDVDEWFSYHDDP